MEGLIRDQNNNIKTKVHRKPTDNSIFLHWQSHAPKRWKWGSLRTLVLRAYNISSDEYLKEELDYISKVFHENNKYPLWVIHKVLNEVKQQQLQYEQQHQAQHQIQEDTYPVENGELQVHLNDPAKNNFLLLPYKGQKGEYIMNSMKRFIEKLLPTDTKTNVTYTGRKLSTFFPIKDKNKFDNEHDIVYHVKCPSDLCNENYVGECGRRIIERIKDHSGRDNKSHMLKHSITSGHRNVTKDDFTIVAKKFKNNKWKRKVSESLIIKDLRPTLNVHDYSVPLKLFN